MAKYAPLKFVEHCEEMKEKFGENKSWTFLEMCAKTTFPTMTEGKILKIALRPDFMYSNYSGIHPEVNKAAANKKTIKIIEEKWNSNDKKNYQRTITEVRDFLVMDPILQKWSKNKQVYKIDKDFIDILISTEKLDIYRDILLHLPYNTFYVDLSDARIPNIEGEYVHVHNDGDEFCIVIFILTSPQVVFSHYIHLTITNDAPFEVEKTDDQVGWDVLPEMLEDIQNPEKLNSTYNDRASLSMLALQLLMYIGSNEPDIEENPISKSVYSPTCMDKLSYKTVRTWDVGVRYGNSLRLFKKTVAKEAKNGETKSKTISRNTPRPHMRCAHWQRYHVGKGRTETIVKWIPPVMVLGSKEMPLTIHNVT